jgi:hypothetical protein
LSSDKPKYFSSFFLCDFLQENTRQNLTSSEFLLILKYEENRKKMILVAGGDRQGKPPAPN